jgi:NDP-sugar pyrophosphorylase family protein
VTLVVLAAGYGTRFGGPKQLAQVGPNGETVADVLLARARETGIEHAVVVVSPPIRAEMQAHFDAHPPAMPVTLVTQAKRRGTADAVATARTDLDGSFLVVNADDVYPRSAFATLAQHLPKTDEHAMVGFRAANTVTGPQPVARALVATDDDGYLVQITEGHITPDGDALRFGSRLLRGDELVSMNIWAFQPSIFDHIDEVVARAAADAEAYLPDAVAVAVSAGDRVCVFATDDRCVELTYRDDIDVVRAAMS